MISSVMIPTLVLVGQGVDPEPPDPPDPRPDVATAGGPGRYRGDSGRMAVRINGRTFVGTDDEILALMRAMGDRAAGAADVPTSRKRARLQARRMARKGPTIEFEPLALAPETGEPLAQILARQAVLMAQARATYGQRLADTLLALHLQEERQNEEAAIAAATMLL